MTYSVVIPSLANETTKPYLKLCVESLRESGFGGNIIVATNGDYKPDLKDIKGITVHTHSKRQGQCGAANAGAQLMNMADKYLMVCNDDMYFAPGWDNKLRFDHLCFSPNLIEPTTNNGSAKPFLKRDWGYTIDEFKKDRAEDGVVKTVTAMNMGQNAFDEPIHKEEPGFNLPFFINAEVWRTIGGYDERYDPWGSNSDTDFQTKINLAGIVPMRLRDVLVYHFSNKSGTFDGTHQEDWQRNWEYFDAKWGFNRDVLGSDVWMNEKMLPEKDDITYNPVWKWKYLDE